MTDVKLCLLHANTWKHLTVYKNKLRFVKSTKYVYNSYIFNIHVSKGFSIK